MSAISITVGAVIGSGIFLKPLGVAQALPSEAWIHTLWLGLGLVCLCGAFAYAELGAMFPEAGGQYAFLREGWGRFVGFLYGWTFFWVINAGTVAALAIAFAKNLLPLFGYPSGPLRLQPEHAAQLVGMDGLLAQAQHVVPSVGLGVFLQLGVDTGEPMRLTVAVAMILLLAVVNHFGVGIGALVQNLSTFAKVFVIGLIVVGGLFFAGAGTSGSGGSAAAPAAGAAAGATVAEWTLAGFVSAFMGIFWAYEGWYQMPFNAAELKRPERNLPLGLIGGMVILIGLYLLINVIYLRAVPFEQMRAMPEGTPETIVASLTIERVFSPQLSGYLTLLIAISIFGAANPNLLSSPRAFYAMGQDGLVPAALTRVHGRWGTPTVAIWTQALVGATLVLTMRTFGDVTDFVVFASFLFYALTVAAVYRLRVTRPDLPRPYRCTLYPLAPAVFILVAVVFVGATLKDADGQRNALKGLAIIAVGVPFYGLSRRRLSPGPAPR